MLNAGKCINRYEPPAYVLIMTITYTAVSYELISLNLLEIVPLFFIAVNKKNTLKIAGISGKMPP
jgi:hypothetical protein